MSTNAADLLIREAGADDVGLLLEFVRQLAEYEQLSHTVTATEESMRAHLFGSTRAAEALLAFEGETPVGFALYFQTFSTFLARPGLWLEDIFVKPAFRGKGYGKALLVRVARVAHQRGCGRYEWSALDWNTPAIEFYKALGAQPLNQWMIFRVSSEALERLAHAG